MVSALNSRELMKDWLAKATPGEIENWADIGLRHKSGVKPEDRLRRFINIARHFGYATRDDSWGGGFFKATLTTPSTKKKEA